MINLKPISYCLAAGLISSCATSSQTAAPIATSELSNSTQFARSDTLHYWSYNSLGVKAAPLIVKQGNEPRPTQSIDSDGDGTIDGVAALVDLPAAGNAQLDIYRTAKLPAFTKRTQAEISHKTGGDWVAHKKIADKKMYEGGTFVKVNELTPPPYYTDHSNWIRYEGPGLESDKVAYRIYLDWRNGFDIFGKLTDQPILQKVGQDGYDSYHDMQPWGMDILKVGKSLGAGGFGFYDGTEVQGVNTVSSHTATITNNGPIFSGVKIDYQDWQINGQTLDASAHLTMQAGSRLVHNTVTLTKPLPNLAIGVVKHPNTELITGNMDIPGDSYTYLASFGQQSLAGDNLGMAVIFRKRDFIKFADDPASYTAVMAARGDFLDYYFVAAWQGEHGNGIATKEAFIEFLEQEIAKLTLPARERFSSVLSKQAKKGPLTSTQALQWSAKMAESELERKALNYHYDGWDVNRRRPPKFEYDIVGMLPWSYNLLADALNKPAYRDVLSKVTGSFIESDGNIKRYTLKNYNIDSVAPGRAVLALYKNTGEEKYKKAADILRHQLEGQPKTSEGAFWHKKKYPGQLWLDGVYMGMPFLAEYSLLFEDGASLEEVVNEFILTEKYLRDSNTGLYYHAWDELKAQDWADKTTGRSPHFWARGLGWFAMALVDVLDIIPEEKTELRAPLLRMSHDLAKALVNYQDSDTYTWWQIMDMPEKTGNYRESSASAMFTYFFAKGVNNGYLPENYHQQAINSYQGLINEFVRVNTDGTISMTNQCLVAGLGYGRDGSFDYYMSEQVYEDDPKGTVPFMIAGIEIAALLTWKLNN